MVGLWPSKAGPNPSYDRIMAVYGELEDLYLAH